MELKTSDKFFFGAVFFIAGAVVGAVAGFFGVSFFGGGDILPPEDLYESRAYKFINPLLACNASDEQTTQVFRPLERELTAALGAMTADSDVTVSLYLKQLKTGHQTALNGSARYAPASLLKIPIMMAFYKVAESSPEILRKTLRYDGAEDLNVGENFKPFDSVQPGKYYTVAELIESMIINSDNNAMMLLRDAIDEKALSEVFTDLGLTVPELGADPDFMNVKNYSRFFRVLYHATYLSRASSEKALELLTREKPFRGIVAGVPEGIVVAQKFGERGMVTDAGDVAARELHDCGIVYDPGSPYLLCVMTKGSVNFEKLTDIIQKISGIVYARHRDA